MKQKIRIWLRNFLGFSRSETNGFIILLLLMVISLAMPFISKKIYITHQSSIHSQHDKTTLDSLLLELENNIEIKKEASNERRFRSFDLNKSSTQHLEEAGFPAYLAERIVNYRNKVKAFESKEELLKIYGMDSAFYQKIKPYVTLTKIPKENSIELEKKQPKEFKNEWDKNSSSKEKKRPKETIRFNINEADHVQLQMIYGIGPTYSERIIKYRKYLGGFHSLQQLNEVYGLQKEEIDSLKKYTFVDREHRVKTLNLNQLDADSLVKHPYISYKEANLIVNYRKQHGNFKSVADLLSIKVLDSAWIKKVSPYVTFD
jgi:DNA uptake protein ComE-like DNA-binding protein